MTTPETTVRRPDVGDPAPKFDLPSYPSGNVSLESYAGKKNVILAFYPKDDTPGCTKEMCAFSADLAHFTNANTQVLGISIDDVPSHEKFSKKFNLQQPLLADVGGKVGKQYGVVHQDGGTAKRTLFVIDKQGKVAHVFEGMPTNADLLEVVKNLP